MKELARIQQLLFQVPHPPEEDIPDGITDLELDGFEQRTGIVLPSDVRQFLKVTNGPCVGPGGIFGIRPRRTHLDMERRLGLHDSWKSRKWLPVASDGCGNYYIIPTQQEYGSGFPVVFVDTIDNPDAPAYIVASDMGHFLIALLESEMGVEGWPFDKNIVLTSDPGIAAFTGVPLPWEAD